MLTRRTAVALAVAALGVTSAAYAMFPRGGSASPAEGFVPTIFLSPTGSNSNNCTSVSTPCDISTLMYTPNGSHSAAYYQALFAGQDICLLPGYYPLDSYWEAQIPEQSEGYNNGYTTLLNMPPGTISAWTHLASCNSSGVYSPRTATLDAHRSATTGQSSVTEGIAGAISGITTGSGSTVITLINSGGENPFTGMTGQGVWFCGTPTTTELSDIGLSPCGASNATLYTITAVNSSTPYTVTISATTSGTFTPDSGGDEILWNYPRGCGTGLIGQARNSVTTSSWGYWIIDGVNITGPFCNGVYYSPSGTAGGSFQITGVTTGSTTVFTVSIPTTDSYVPSTSQHWFFSGLTCTGSCTLTNLNFVASSGNYYTPASVSGSSPTYTVTFDTATTGTYNSSSVAYAAETAPPIIVENSEIYDGNGIPADNSCGAIYTLYTNELLVTNNKLHQFCQGGPGGLGWGQGIEEFGDYNSIYEYNTIWGVVSGIELKSYPQGNITVQYNYIETPFPNPPGAAGSNFWGVAIDDWTTSITPGMVLTIQNNILFGQQSALYTGTDTPPQSAGAIEFINNTVYWPYNNSASGQNFTGIDSSGSWSTSGRLTFNPPASATICNNLFNQAAGGQGAGGYIRALSAGTAGAPTSINIAASNWNLFDADSEYLTGLDFSYTSIEFVSPGTYYDFAQWKSDTGFDAASATGSPTYSSANLGHAYPTSNFELTSGSNGHLLGHVGCTSGGAATDVGAWGGIDVNTGEPPAQIGSSF